jgi:hypothetical protein
MIGFTFGLAFQLEQPKSARQNPANANMTVAITKNLFIFHTNIFQVLNQKDLIIFFLMLNFLSFYSKTMFT